jgi:ferredoxin
MIKKPYSLMAKYKITVDQDVCIGCGACSATCPDFFDIKDTADGQKAKAKKPDVDDFLCAKEAAEVCPVNCIHVAEGAKKII